MPRAIAVLLAVLVVVTGCGASEQSARCTIRGTPYTFTAEQTANAATIAAVGRQLGIPDRGVTVALAAAMQESRLRNLPYGDRDSQGLFQQRPSQGWGTPEQVTRPRYAATAFYAKLVQLPGWEQMRLTDAAQAVQSSAFPEAYQQWEDEAQALNAALGGQVSGVNCTEGATPILGRDERSAELIALVATDLDADAVREGEATLSVAPRDQPWIIVSWLVAHSEQLGLAAVGYDGRRWAAGSGWTTQPGTGTDAVVVELS